MFDALLFFDGFGPMQIMIVLIVALLLFGPKRLPEIGKQIGSTLRELKRAGSEVVNSFSSEYEPERNGHSYDKYENPVNDYERTDVYASSRSLSAPPDLTDYTIAGQPIKESASNGSSSNGSPSPDLTDYTIARGSLDDPKKVSD
jgi:sec-independent protein translocase protein TatA